jgi:hypothetical protein
MATVHPEPDEGAGGDLSVRKLAVAERFEPEKLDEMEKLLLASGHNGRVMRSGRDLIEAAPEALKCGKLGHVMFWKTAVLATLNTYSIFSRFAERPDRDPDEDYNLSRLVLAWIETIIMSSVLFSFIVAGHGAVCSRKSKRPGEIPVLSNILWMLSAFSLLLFLPSAALS